MHKENQNLLKSGNDQPNFIRKLYHILQDCQNWEFIHWTSAGQGFEISNEQLLRENVLPRYYRHSNISSFIRQVHLFERELNMYGFRKVKEGDRQFYMHMFFRRDNPELSIKISRRPEKKIVAFEDSSNFRKESEESIKLSEDSLKIIEESEEVYESLKSSILDKYLAQKIHESSSAIKTSQKHISILKSESLANMMGKSEVTILKCSDLDNINDDKLSICENLAMNGESEVFDD